MDVEGVRCLEHGGRLDDPFAAAGRNEYSQDCRVSGNNNWERVGGADRQDQLCYSVRNPRASNHPEDHRIEWELDEYSFGGRDSLGNRPDELSRPPLQQEPA